MSAYHQVRLDPDAKPSKEYVYLTANRERHSLLQRFDLDDGEKTFRQWHWDEDIRAGGAWVPGKPDEPVPYHLDLIHDAPADTVIYVTEGEQGADRLKPFGWLATTNAGGAEKWSPALNIHFEGRKYVVIFADNDEPGRRHARMVARNLAPFVEEIRIVYFPDLPEHGDVTDWLDLGHTKEELLARIAASPIFSRPEIEVKDGELVDIVNKAEAALLAADVGIYQRGDELVRAVQVARHEGDGLVRRQAVSTVLVSVGATWLREQMARTAFWFEKKLINKMPIQMPVDPPRDYPQTLLARRQGEWNFRPLSAVILTPTMERDGRIVQLPGYDTASRLLLDFKSGDFPEVPDQPTLLDAQRALLLFADSNPVDLPLEERKGLLRGFPFADGPSKAVALSALLSSLVRVNLRTVPLHAFDAPTAGTGKSMLAEMAGILSMGQRPAAMSQGKSAEEDEKRLSTVLHAGDPVILIDNIEDPLEGDFLCSMLTQEVVQARILGKSERRILPSTALVLATGNNLILQGDVSRRAVVCRLDAKEERPDARVFTFDAQADLMEDRPTFVVAALTALRAYALATDKPKLSPVGSFQDYDLIRGTLIWCGYDDPADTRNAILAEDPKKAELIDVMGLWARQYGDNPISVASLGLRDVHDPLRMALANATAKDGIAVWNGKSVGWWLKRNEDKIVGGRAFRKLGEGMWKLDGGATEPI